MQERRLPVQFYLLIPYLIVSDFNDVSRNAYNTENLKNLQTIHGQNNDTQVRVKEPGNFMQSKLEVCSPLCNYYFSDNIPLHLFCENS